MNAAAGGNHQADRGASHGPSVASSNELNAEEADFQASSSFTGPKDGFVFKTGEQGTGYYKDAPLHLRKIAAKAKPAMLKTNSSIIKNIPRRNVPLPDAKKRKTEESSSSDKPSSGYLKEMERYRQMSCSAETKHDRPLVK